MLYGDRQMFRSFFRSQRHQGYYLGIFQFYKGNENARPSQWTNSFGSIFNISNEEETSVKELSTMTKRKLRDDLKPAKLLQQFQDILNQNL